MQAQTYYIVPRQIILTIDQILVVMKQPFICQVLDNEATTINFLKSLVEFVGELNHRPSRHGHYYSKVAQICITNHRVYSPHL